MKIANKKAVESFKICLASHAERHANAADAFDVQANAEGATDETRAECKANAKWHRTHAKANTLLALSGDAAIGAYITLSGDNGDKCDTRSREFKERAAVVCYAIANKRPIDGDRKHGDRAADAAVQYILATTGDEYTLASIQKQMAHETTTQAGYFASFVAGMNAGHKVKNGFKIDRAAAFWSALRECYGMKEQTENASE